MAASKSKETAKREADRVSSGIPGLDKLIGGGYIVNDIYLVTGGTGTGKTLFCCQFLWEGLQKGEKSIFFSLEELPDDVLHDAAVFGWDFQKYISSGMFSIEYQDPFEMVDIASMVREKIQKFGAKRIVIDSTSIFGMVFEKEHELRKSLYNLIKQLKGIDCVVLMTAEVVEGSKGLSRYGVEEFVVDGVITLASTNVGGEFFLNLQVKKMRRTPHEKGLYPYEISTKGIEILSSK
ncbi:MAG: hypothetical protein HYY37_04065 [Candidatus Aenigmarchaeota archaeon]|nr:hypothetical protein [Candidatus Aenigmarchaeota archaeon]